MSSASDRTSLEIPSSGVGLEPALKFLEAFASEAGVSAERALPLHQASRLALELVLKNQERRLTEEARVGLQVYQSDGYLLVEISNRGVPLFANGSMGEEFERFHEVSRPLDRVALENRGREGQSVVLAAKLSQEVLKRNFAHGVAQPPSEIETGEVQYRELKRGEEKALSQLFYYVYGYNYINDFVYYPEKIEALIASGELISVVASTKSGQLVGHVGLRKWNHSPPVYEPSLGVVHPEMKSRGVFGRLFEQTMARVRTTPMHYSFFDFVTNHVYSQRFISRYQPADMAIFVGCQDRATQASLDKLGLGHDCAEMDRYSLLFSILPGIAHPFGKEIRLSSNLGEWLGFLLQPLNLHWTPAPRFDSLPSGGEYKTQMQPAQNAVVFDLVKPGREAVAKILSEWQSLLRLGYQYAGVEVPVAAPGLGNLYDCLAEHGFFISGFVPYRLSDQLGMRFQTIGPTRVAWDEIKVFSPTAKKLLAIIRQDYERNGLL